MRLWIDGQRASGSDTGIMGWHGLNPTLPQRLWTFDLPVISTTVHRSETSAPLQPGTGHTQAESPPNVSPKKLGTAFSLPLMMPQGGFVQPRPNLTPVRQVLVQQASKALVVVALQ
jgi:hypothetical protein